MQRKRWKISNVMSQVAALGVVVCVTILSVGPGVKRLYALDTPQSKNMNILIEVMCILLSISMCTVGFFSASIVWFHVALLIHTGPGFISTCSIASMP